MGPGGITAAIMAGGRSTRMGRDKAMMMVAGRPMLEHVVQAAHDAGLDILVIGRERPVGWCGPDAGFVPDDHPDAGPLGGVATALRCAGTPVLALACDMPWISAEAIRWLLDVDAVAGGVDGVVARNGDRLEPMLAIYHRSCTEPVNRMIAAGDLALMALIRALHFAEAVVPDALRPALHNVNTPDDLAAGGG